MKRVDRVILLPVDRWGNRQVVKLAHRHVVRYWELGTEPRSSVYSALAP